MAHVDDLVITKNLEYWALFSATSAEWNYFARNEMKNGKATIFERQIMKLFQMLDEMWWKSKTLLIIRIFSLFVVRLNRFPFDFRLFSNEISNHSVRSKQTIFWMNLSFDNQIIQSWFRTKDAIQWTTNNPTSSYSSFDSLEYCLKLAGINTFLWASQ